jgi:DNA-binding response OmpR family regulator
VILIVEDHRPTRTFLADNLAADGYEPLTAGTAAEARRVLERDTPELALVDLGLPDRDGLELVREVREADGLGRLDPNVPLLALSGRSAELDRIRAFRSGFDDYVTKPFSYHELHARIAALLRRSRRRPTGGRVRIGPLELDSAGRQAWLHGQPLELSK